MFEQIILVDKNDKKIGVLEKLEAHKKGLLHRAFSIFIFNSKGEMLLTKRAKSKYHSAGLWTNACCSHPRPNEDIKSAALRRLKEELGFGCDLKEIFSFIYKAPFSNGLTEYEFDHVFIGTFDGEVRLDPNDADNYKWISVSDLKKSLADNQEIYSFWFKDSIDKVLNN